MAGTGSVEQQPVLEHQNVAAATVDASGAVVPTASAQAFLYSAVGWLNARRRGACGVADKSVQHGTDGLAQLDVETFALVPAPALTAIQVTHLPNEDGLIAAPDVVKLVVSNPSGIHYLIQQDGVGSFLVRLAIWLTMAGLGGWSELACRSQISCCHRSMTSPRKQTRDHTLGMTKNRSAFAKFRPKSQAASLTSNSTTRKQWRPAST
jgi:hypothetical protein